MTKVTFLFFGYFFKKIDSEDLHVISQKSVFSLFFNIEIF